MSKTIQETSFLERTFKLKENNTNVKTEVIAGLTTFLTMVYIIFVNPDILSTTGMPWQGVFIATILASIVGTVLMGLLANYPFALAPGMGLNAFFAYSVASKIGWQGALALVFIEGVIFIVLSATKFRTVLINSIPMSLKAAISAGIGLFIALIGLTGSGIVVSDPNTYVALGDLTSPEVLTALFGLLVAAILYAKKVRGALLWSILAATVLECCRVSEFPESLPEFLQCRNGLILPAQLLNSIFRRHLPLVQLD